MEPLQDHEIDSDEEMEGNWIDMERIQFALEAEQMFQNDNDNLDNAVDETQRIRNDALQALRDDDMGLAADANAHAHMEHMREMRNQNQNQNRPLRRLRDFREERVARARRLRMRHPDPQNLLEHPQRHRHRRLFRFWREDVRGDRGDVRGGGDGLELRRAERRGERRRL